MGFIRAMTARQAGDNGSSSEFELVSKTLTSASMASQPGNMIEPKPMSTLISRHRLKLYVLGRVLTVLYGSIAIILLVLTFIERTTPLFPFITLVVLGFSVIYSSISAVVHSFQRHRILRSATSKYPSAMYYHPGVDVAFDLIIWLSLFGSWTTSLSITWMSSGLWQDYGFRGSGKAYISRMYGMESTGIILASFVIVSHFVFFVRACKRTKKYRASKRAQARE